MNGAKHRARKADGRCALSVRRNMDHIQLDQLTLVTLMSTALKSGGLPRCHGWHFCLYYAVLLSISTTYTVVPFENESSVMPLVYTEAISGYRLVQNGSLCHSSVQKRDPPARKYIYANVTCWKATSSIVSLPAAQYRGPSL